MNTLAIIVLGFIVFIIGLLIGWFFTSLQFSRDPKFVMLKDSDVIVHKYDLEILIATAPRHVKKRLAEDRIGKIKEIAEQEIKDEE